MASGWDFLGLSCSSSIIDNSDVARIGWGDEVAEGVWHMSRARMAVSRPSSSPVSVVLPRSVNVFT
jgi:hypothetical protein